MDSHTKEDGLLFISLTLKITTKINQINWSYVLLKLHVLAS